MWKAGRKPGLFFLERIIAPFSASSFRHGSGRSFSVPFDRILSASLR